MREHQKNAIAGVVAAVGVIFIAIGIWRGEIIEVLQKAVRICLECIGIG